MPAPSGLRCQVPSGICALPKILASLKKTVGKKGCLIARFPCVCFWIIFFLVLEGGKWGEGEGDVHKFEKRLSFYKMKF